MTWGRRVRAAIACLGAVVLLVVGGAPLRSQPSGSAEVIAAADAVAALVEVTDRSAREIADGTPAAVALGDTRPGLRDALAAYGDRRAALVRSVRAGHVGDAELEQLRSPQIELVRAVAGLNTVIASSTVPLLPPLPPLPDETDPVLAPAAPAWS